MMLMKFWLQPEKLIWRTCRNMIWIISGIKIRRNMINGIIKKHLSKGRCFFYALRRGFRQRERGIPMGRWWEKIKKGGTIGIVCRHHPDSRIPINVQFRRQLFNQSFITFSPWWGSGNWELICKKRKKAAHDGGRLFGSKILPLRWIFRWPEFRSYLSIGCRNSYVWIWHLVTRVRSRGARIRNCIAWLDGSLFWCKNIGIVKCLEDWKAYGTRGSCSGSAWNFYARGGSDGARPEALFFCLPVDIVEKNPVLYHWNFIKLLNSGSIQDFPRIIPFHRVSAFLQLQTWEVMFLIPAPSSDCGRQGKSEKGRRITGGTRDHTEKPHEPKGSWGFSNGNAPFRWLAEKGIGCG